MKKAILVILSQLFLFFSYSEQKHIVSIGVDSPIINYYIQSEAKSQKLSGSGLGVDIQYRFNFINSLYLMSDIDLSFMDFNNGDGLEGAFLFGIGRDFAKKNNLNLVMSVFTGGNFLLSDILDDLYKVNLKTYYVLLGFDLFANIKFSKNIGLFASTTIGGGLGKTLLKKDDLKENANAQNIFFVPKIGLSINF